jgi:hypothetical protein
MGFNSGLKGLISLLLVSFSFVFPFPSTVFPTLVPLFHPTFIFLSYLLFIPV